MRNTTSWTLEQRSQDGILQQAEFICQVLPRSLFHIFDVCRSVTSEPDPKGTCGCVVFGTLLEKTRTTARRSCPACPVPKGLLFRLPLNLLVYFKAGAT